MLRVMAPSPIPAPLPPWARALIQALPFISTGLQIALEYIGELNTASDPNPGSWRRIQWVWEHTGDADPANRCIFTWDVANITNGAVDGSWTDADYTTVEGHCNTWFTSVKPLISGNARLLERRYYVMTFSDLVAGTPLEDDDPFIKSGAPERTYPIALPGTAAASVMPSQVAVSVTERTTYPRHWGRFYVPYVALSGIGTDGLLTNAFTDNLGSATATAYQALQDDEFFPVVPVTQIEKAPARGLLTTTQVQVDNVFDVIRRRRIKKATHYYRNPITL